MSKTIVLASGQITPADTLTIELVEADETPTMILLRWPDAPSVSEPRRFPATANAVMRILATASVQLAEIRVRERR